MFNKKRLYKITYKDWFVNTTIAAAKSKAQTLKNFIEQIIYIMTFFPLRKFKLKYF